MINLRGQTLMEVMVATGVVALILPALLTAHFSSRGGGLQEELRVEALALAREAREVVAYMRDVGWDEVAENGVYHPELVPGGWELVGGVESVGEMTREIVIEDASRDSEGQLTSGEGAIDPSVKHVRVRVGWGSLIPREVEWEFFLMRLENLTRLETTKDDFEQGVKVGTTVTEEEDGEVTLGAGGSGNWCEPGLTISAVDLPKSGVANAISAREGEVVAGTGENASGVSYARVAVTNSKPPVGTVEGTFDGYKTNAVYGEEGYSYLATDTNSREVVVIDTSRVNQEGKYELAGYYDAPGNKSAEGVFVQGNIGFAVVDTWLYTFDLSSKSGQRPTLGGISLSGPARGVTVVGNYAYVVVAGSTRAMEIIEFDAGGGNLSIVGFVELAGQAGRQVVVNETATRAFLAAENNTGKAELYVIEIGEKTGSRPVLGEYETGEMDPEGIAVVTNGKVIVVGRGGEEYQVVSVSDGGEGGVEIERCGGLQIDVGVNGVEGVVEGDGDAYAYIITRDSGAELKIIEGGPGGSVAMEGYYESATFDAGKDSVFNRFEVEESLPAQTSIKYQVASTAAAESCEGVSYNFVGPDLTSGTFFVGSSQLPLLTQVGYANPGRCFRYRAYLSTEDGSVAPALLSILLNYSP